MKHVHIVLEDSEHKKLLKRKGEKSWHDFILQGTENDKESTATLKS